MNTLEDEWYVVIKDLVYNSTLRTYLSTLKICWVELCTELFYSIIPTLLLCFLLIYNSYISLRFQFIFCVPYIEMNMYLSVKQEQKYLLWKHQRFTQINMDCLNKWEACVYWLEICQYIHCHKHIQSFSFSRRCEYVQWVQDGWEFSDSHPDLIHQS